MDYWYTWTIAILHTHDTYIFCRYLSKSGPLSMLLVFFIIQIMYGCDCSEKVFNASCTQSIRKDMYIHNAHK